MAQARETDLQQKSKADSSNASSKRVQQLPLQYKWTLWYNAPSKSWRDKETSVIGHFATVPDFWRLFNNLCPPSRLQPGSDYHLFKGNVKPEWEDTFNAKGGTWTFRYNNLDALHIDHAWYHTVLNMIGHNFDYSDDICGLVISPRKGRGKVCLWIRDAKDTKAVLSIGKQFKYFCGVNEKEYIGFQSHETAKSHPKRQDEQV